MRSYQIMLAAVTVSTAVLVCGSAIGQEPAKPAHACGTACKDGCTEPAAGSCGSGDQLGALGARGLGTT